MERTKINNKLTKLITKKEFIDELTCREYHHFYKKSDVERFLEENNIKVVYTSFGKSFEFEGEQKAFMPCGDGYSLVSIHF